MAKTTTLKPWERVTDPNSFSALVALWESNYSLLERLIPDLRKVPSGSVSRGDANCPLHLHSVHHERYTATFILTHRFPDKGEVPRLKVRVFFDAKAAQALDVEKGDFGENLYLQIQRNAMLNKWLDWCLEQGHGFWIRKDAA